MGACDLALVPVECVVIVSGNSIKCISCSKWANENKFTVLNIGIIFLKHENLGRANPVVPQCSKLIRDECYKQRMLVEIH